MIDKVKFKIVFSDSRSGKILHDFTTDPIRQVQTLSKWLDSYEHYLLSRPYTRLVITPLVSVDSGELFTNLKFDENV